MPSGPAWPNENGLALWRANYKINTEYRSFNYRVWLAAMTEANAFTKAEDIGKRLRDVLTTDTEIFYAHISRWDSRKDSRYVPDCVGRGTYGPGDEETEPEKYDHARTALLLRLEANAGGYISPKVAPLPDSVVEGGWLLAEHEPDPVKGRPEAPPALAEEEDDWKTRFNLFLQGLVFHTHYVPGPIMSGGQYEYDEWRNGYAMRISSKKGGRVFS